MNTTFYYTLPFRTFPCLSILLSPSSSSRFRFLLLLLQVFNSDSYPLVHDNWYSEPCSGHPSPDFTQKIFLTVCSSFLTSTASSAFQVAPPVSPRFRRPRPAHRLPVGGGHRHAPVSRFGAVAHPLPSRRLGIDLGNELARVTWGWLRSGSTQAHQV